MLRANLASCSQAPASMSSVGEELIEVALIRPAGMGGGCGASMKQWRLIDGEEVGLDIEPELDIRGQSPYLQGS